LRTILKNKRSLAITLENKAILGRSFRGKAGDSRLRKS